MNIKHIQKAALGKWQYRCRRFPESIKAALGRNDFKRVLKARSEAEVLREYPRIEAEFDHIVEGASVTKAVVEGDVSKLCPREMWSLALYRAEKLVAGVRGYDPIEDDRRDIVAASICLTCSGCKTMNDATTAAVNPDDRPSPSIA